MLRDQLTRDLQDMVQNGSGLLDGALSSWQMPAFLGPSMMMLLALSLENLAKGLTVVRNPHMPPFRSLPGSRLQRPYHSHSIIDLLTKKPGISNDVGAGVKLSPAERAQVGRLENFLMWGGRYPVPVDPMLMHYALPDTEPLSWSSDDLAVTDELLDRVRLELEAEVQAWSAAQATIAEAEEKRRWVEVLATVADLPTQDSDGATTFVDMSGADEPGGAIACCQAMLVVNARFPAALCRCGNLYYYAPYGDPTIQRERVNVSILRAGLRPT